MDSFETRLEMIHFTKRERERKNSKLDNYIVVFKNGFVFLFVPPNDMIPKVLFVRGTRTWSRYKSPMFGFIAVKNVSCAEIGRIFHMTGHVMCLPRHKQAGVSPRPRSHIHVNIN